MSGLALGRRAWLAGASSWLLPSPLPAHAGTQQHVPVLVYHRVGEQAVDSMTVSEATFVRQLDAMQSLGCNVIPLSLLVAWLRDGTTALPRRAVVLTADDGHQSQFECMRPLLAARDWPVALFVYPSAISNASYAMHWPDLRSWQAQGRCEVESHTFWHPHLLRERRARTPADFERFARTQLLQGRQRIEQALGRPVRRLAWPFGMADEGLAALAAQTGHDAGFTLGNRAAGPADDAFALPRYLVTEATRPQALAQWLRGTFGDAAG